MCFLIFGFLHAVLFFAHNNVQTFLSSDLIVMKVDNVPLFVEQGQFYSQ
ncbi:hypothetical protein D9736_07165 [Escherichia sp. E10V10]|nr:hypothetical protein D9736_07165 [Escherichia sp. E10V10]